MAGLRFNAGKPRFDLLPADALFALADHYRKGAEKYTVTHTVDENGLLRIISENCTCQNTTKRLCATQTDDMRLRDSVSSVTDVTRDSDYSGMIRKVLSEHSPTCDVHNLILRPNSVTVLGDHNWTKGMAWSKCFASLQRHAWAWMRGEDYDIGTPEEPGTGSHHMISVAWNAIALFVYSVRGIGKDDRPKKG